jgi:hypothetical protein
MERDALSAAQRRGFPRARALGAQYVDAVNGEVIDRHLETLSIPSPS